MSLKTRSCKTIRGVRSSISLFTEEQKLEEVKIQPNLHESSFWWLRRDWADEKKFQTSFQWSYETFSCKKSCYIHDWEENIQVHSFLLIMNATFSSYSAWCIKSMVKSRVNLLKMWLHCILREKLTHNPQYMFFMNAFCKFPKVRSKTTSIKNTNYDIRVFYMKFVRTDTYI